MTRIVITWIANSLAILAVSSFIGSVSVGSVQTAFAAGLVLTLINAIVRPVVVILTLPLTFVTLGLFYFVITGFCLWLTSHLIDGFAVHGFFMTVVASILISVISAVLAKALGKE